MRPSSPPARHRRAPITAVFAVALAVAAASLPASAQTPGGSSDPFGLQPRRPPNAPPGQRPPAPTPAPAASPVIARVGARAITQSDFDRVAQPYYRTLRAQLGEGFTPDVQRLAAFNVLDELVRREVLVIEAERRKIAVSQADIDAILMQEPIFLTDGKFDPARLTAYKTSPSTNYLSVLPRIREMAAITRLDDSVRQRFTPTAAQVRAEWERRSEQVRFKVLPLMTRDMPLEPEAPETAWAEYYRAHPDQFMRRTRVRLRYLRLPLPAEGDSTRAAEETRALERAKAIADSLRTGTLADTAAGFTDSGPFEIPTPVLPGLGRVPGLTDSISRAETDSSVRVVGPHVGRSAVIVGVVADRQPRYLPPLLEVLGEVKRRADAEHRRVTAEDGQRAYYQAHLERWRGTRASLTRIVLDPATVVVKPPLPGEVDAWYAQHGRALFDLPDSSKAWLPPLDDSLRTVAAARMADERRGLRVAETMGRIVQGFRSTRDARALARANGAAAETLTLAPHSAPDPVFGPPFVDSLLASAAVRTGTVEGPRRFAALWAAWRIEAVDTSFVAPYEAVRVRSDQGFADQRREEDEDEGRRYFEAHREDYRTPVRFALDYVVVPIPPADSVRIPEAELRRRYEANRSSYRQEEQVRARHILFMTREPGPEVDARAKARADSLLAAIRLEGGEFAELARRFSQEPGASTSGGDLGWFGRGGMVKEFEVAAFALQPGEISPVVKTQFGYHIIKLEQRRAAGTRPFDEVRGELRAQIAQARGDSTARRVAAALRRRLALGGDVAALAAPHGGLVSAPPIVATEPVPGVGIAPDLPPDLPGLTPGRWAAQPYRAGSAFLVLRVRERIPPGPAGFDEAKLRAMDDMRNAKRHAALDRRVESVRAALTAGATLDSLAARYGGLRDSGLRTRSAAFIPVIGSDPRIMERAFSMREGEVSDTLHVADGVAWLRLEERPPADAAALAASRPQIERELLKQRYDEWLEARKRTVRIEILRPDLKGSRSARPGTP